MESLTENMSGYDLGDFSDTEYVSTSAGILLRHARVHEGLTHRSVATQLGLMVSHVRAIEDNCWEAVCDDETSLEYVRSYAALVGLDSDKIADLYGQHASTTGCSARQDDAIIVTVSPASNRRFSNCYWVSVPILLAVGVWAFNAENHEKNAHQLVVTSDEFSNTVSHTNVEGELKDGIRTVAIGVKQIFTAFKLYTASAFSETAAEIRGL